MTKRRPKADRTRSSKNLGSINQRENGRWVWQDDLGVDPHTGRRIRPTRERATRKEVVLARDEALAQLARQPTSTPVAPETVAEWLAEWLRTVGARSDRSPATYANYESSCRNHIVPAIGHLKLATLSSEDVATMLNGKSAATRHLIHRALAVAWSEAWRAQKVVDKEVVLRVPRIAQSVRQTGATTAIELEEAILQSMNALAVPAREAMRARDQVAVLRVLETDRLRARYLLGMIYGPRQSEVLGFGWPDLEVVDQVGILKIRRSRVRQEWEHGCHPSNPCGVSRSKCPLRAPLPTVKGTKTHGSVRALHLNPGMLAILLEWRDLQAAEFRQLGITPRIPWMFTDLKGNPPSHSKDQKDWQDVLRGAQASRHYSLHDLRHTAASEAAANLAIDLPTLMGMFGWTRRQTAEVYSHARDDRLQLAWEQQEARFMQPE